MPLAIELEAVVAEPHRGGAAVYLSAVFETTKERLTAYADIKVDRAEEVVVQERAATMPPDADVVSWAQDEVDHWLA